MRKQSAMGASEPSWQMVVRLFLSPLRGLKPVPFRNRKSSLFLDKLPAFNTLKRLQSNCFLMGLAV